MRFRVGDIVRFKDGDRFVVEAITQEGHYRLGPLTMEEGRPAWAVTVTPEAMAEGYKLEQVSLAYRIRRRLLLLTSRPPRRQPR